MQVCLVGLTKSPLKGQKKQQNCQPELCEQLMIHRGFYMQTFNNMLAVCLKEMLYVSLWRLGRVEWAGEYQSGWL